MTRFYVTMTWDDWPEGGSFGTVIEAKTEDHAEALCKVEMAQSAADNERADHVKDALETWGEQWHVVDCFPVDDFIENHGGKVLDAQDRNTILAALRYYQMQGMGEPVNRPDAIHDIATDGDTQISMDADAIDELCERINS